MSLWITDGINRADPESRYIVLGLQTDGDADEAEVAERLDRARQVGDGLYALAPDVLSVDLFEDAGELVVTLLARHDHLLEIPLLERSAELELDDAQTGVVVALAHEGRPTLDEVKELIESGEGRLTLISRRRD